MLCKNYIKYTPLKFNYFGSNYTIRINVIDKLIEMKNRAFYFFYI